MSEQPEQFFTLVFKGDLRSFKGNPLHTNTPFGVPFAAGIGDAFAELVAVTEALDRKEQEEMDRWTTE